MASARWRSGCAEPGEPVPARTVKFRQGIRLLWVLPLLPLLALTSATVVTGVSMLIGGPLAEEPGWRC